MADVPVQIVAAAFNSEDGAEQAFKSLKDAQGAGLVTINSVAVLTKDANGKLNIKEPTDWGGGKGAVIGGVTGAALGLLAGPVGWAVGLGALVGGLAAKLKDSGYSDERLRKLGASLKPSSSALVAVVEHRWVATLERQLAEAGADTLTEEISADIARELEAGHDVAYSALSAAGVVAMDRVSVGKDSADLTSVVATQEGITVTDVSVRPAPEGTAASAAEAAASPAADAATAPAAEAADTPSEQLEPLPKVATPVTPATS
jgi:uncharacterized membrane protein